MNRGFSIKVRTALSLAVVILIGSAAQAQSTAPRGYQGSDKTEPRP